MTAKLLNPEAGLWDYDGPISELTQQITVPRWIDPDISPATVAAICQGGCSSGAYMPAVVYSDALETMGLWGDDSEGVLQYLEDALGDLPTPDAGISWSGLACFYVSCAVELWASSIADELTRILPAEEDE
jgi:hypothetical protein